MYYGPGRAGKRNYGPGRAEKYSHFTISSQNAEKERIHSLRVRIDVTWRHERRLSHYVEKRTVRGGGATEQTDADELVERDAQMERQRERLGVQLCEPQV